MQAFSLSANASARITQADNLSCASPDSEIAVLLNMFHNHNAGQDWASILDSFYACPQSSFLGEMAQFVENVGAHVQELHSCIQVVCSASFSS